MRNLRKTAEAANVDERYDLRAGDICLIADLIEADKYEGIVAAFKYGYVMGSRATLAELKRKRMNNM